MAPKLSLKPADFAAKKLQHSVPGVFTQGGGARLSILNGSHTTISEYHDRETVLIFPDYRVVFGVENTPKAAELLYEKAVSPSTTYIPTIPEELEDGELPFGILPIPYSCVILLCASSLRWYLFSRLFALILKALTSDETTVATSQPPSSNMVRLPWRNQSKHISKHAIVHRIHPRLTTAQLDSRHQPRPPPPLRRPPPLKTSHRRNLSSGS